ncbi:unnamed protein product [Caenorhabditis brenneri]
MASSRINFNFLANKKCLPTLLIIFMLVGETGTAKLNPFKFREKTLEQFNSARRIIASGDVSKILEVLLFALDKVEPFKTFKENGPFGPAADMYKLVWNRQLEQAGYDYVEEHGQDFKNFGKTLYYKDYIGFHWVGDIFDYISLIMKVVPEQLSSGMNKWKELIETLVILLWLLFAMPVSYPVKEGDHFGAGELATSIRYEIGCYSNVALSICFMKKAPYQPRPFLEGAACSSCPTHCEFFMDEDGEEVEGELCVPPDGYYNDQKAEAAALENISSVGDFAGVSIIPIAILLMIWWIRR